MANKPLKTLKFPGLNDVYTIPQLASVAPQYSTNSPYAVGDLVSYENDIYKCVTAITKEAWNASHWTKVSIDSEIGELKNTLTALTYVDISNNRDGWYVNSTDGTISTNVNFSYAEFNIVGKGSLLYTTEKAENSIGIAFYDVYDGYLDGRSAVAGTQEVPIPSGATYARATYRTAQKDVFSIKALKSVGSLIDRYAQDRRIEKIGDIAVDTYNIVDFVKRTKNIYLVGYDTTKYTPVYRYSNVKFVTDIGLLSNVAGAVTPIPSETLDGLYVIVYKENEKAVTATYSEIVNESSQLAKYFTIIATNLHIDFEALIEDGYERVAINGLLSDFEGFYVNCEGVSLDWAKIQETVDPTLTIPGVGADAKVTGDKLDELSTDLSVLLYPDKDKSIDGYMVAADNGTISANENFSYIEFGVVENTRVEYTTGRAETSVGIAFYDMYGAYLDGYPAIKGSQVLETPTNAVTARASYRTSQKDIFTVKNLTHIDEVINVANGGVPVTNIGDLKTEEYDITRKSIINKSLRIKGYDTNNFLPLIQYDANYFTAEIAITPNIKKISIPLPSEIPQYNFAVAFTENVKAVNTTYIQIVNKTSRLLDYIDIKSDAVYIDTGKLLSNGFNNIILEGLTNDFDTFAIKCVEVELGWANVPLPEIGQPKLLTGLSMFGSIHCLGDSYTQGGIKLSNDGEWLEAKKPYPKVLSDMLGIDVTNFGIGGASVKTYLTTGMSNVLAATPPDLYILCFGINDAGKGDTIGSDADIHEDYTENADTFYGNYGRIISQLMNHAPLARFVIIGEWHWNTSSIAYLDYLTAASGVAQHFGIPFINPYNDVFFNSDLYQKTMVAGHPTPVTYVGMAYAVMRLIADNMSTNESYYRFAGLASI